MKLVLGQELDESTLPGLDGIALSPIELSEPESTNIELYLMGQIPKSSEAKSKSKVVRGE